MAVSSLLDANFWHLTGSTVEKRPLRRSAALVENFSKANLLVLIMRGFGGAVRNVRPRGHALVDEPAEDLPVADHEGHVAAAYFKYNARSCAVCRSMSKGAVYEACVMAPELSK